MAFWKAAAQRCLRIGPSRRRPRQRYRRTSSQSFWQNNKLGQVGGAHQVFIDKFSRLASLTDRPNDQGLSASHISCGENTGNIRHFFGVRRDIAAFIDLNAKLFEHPVSFGPQKAHREMNKVAIDGELAAGDFTHIASFELNTNAVKLFDKSVSASEFFSKDAVVAIAALFVCRRR